MVDGTGMCGGCRVAVGGKTKFVCVDGPEFDGHQVDFDLMMKRQRTYLNKRPWLASGSSGSCTNAGRFRRGRRSSDGAPAARQERTDQDPQAADACAGRPRSGSRTSTRWRSATPPSWPSRRPSAASSARSRSASTGCPVAIDIPAFIAAIQRGGLRARPRDHQERQHACRRSAAGSARRRTSARRSACLGKKGEPVAIGRLERFVADWELAQGEVRMPERAPSHGQAGRRRRLRTGRAHRAPPTSPIRGHAVTIFEALHKPGGVLVYGIPEFRLPKEIVQTRDRQPASGWASKFSCNFVVGKTATLDELLEEHGLRRGLHRHRRGPAPTSWTSRARTSSASTRPTSS